MLYQLSYFRISSYLSGHLLRWTSYRQSVIYSSKLPSSSLVRLESDRPYTPVFSFLFCDDFVILRIRWIRTTEGINQQIYSLPHLATLVFSRFFVSFGRFLCRTSHPRSSQPTGCCVARRLSFLDSSRNKLQKFCFILRSSSSDFTSSVSHLRE